MAELFIRQAQVYAKTRPTYPLELFQFIASKTPVRHLVWDVGTGSGQAIPPLAELFKNVVGTDTSQKQLNYAPNLPNVKYHQSPPIMSMDEIQQNIGPQSTVDLVTLAQALHWFDLPKFYDNVKYVLKKPNGVIAAWCYTTPCVNDNVDSVFNPFYKIDSNPYWEAERKMVDKKYMDVYFPFEPVDGLDHTGPFEFEAQKTMSLDDFVTYLKSWSAYNTAKEKGVELLTNEMLEKFEHAWNSGDDASDEKLVRFPIYLRIGKVGNCTSTNCY